MRISNKNILVILGAAVILAVSCKSNTSPGTATLSPVVTDTAGQKTKDIVFVADLVNDSSKIKEYLSWHTKVWPQVEAGFRKAGYRRIRLYRFARTLVMIVTVPENADLAQMGNVAEASDPRCREWNILMDQFQEGVPGTAPGQKWVEAGMYYQFNADSTGR